MIQLLKYITIAALALAFCLFLYLIVPMPDSLFVKEQQFPPEAPIAVETGAQCRPKTIYIIESLKGYSDHEIINTRCFELQQGLVEAIREGNLNVAKDFIRQGANVNSSGWPREGGNGFVAPWVGAVRAEKTDAVKLLLDNGVDVNDSYMCCMTHESPLMVAVGNNDLETMKLLISRCADVNFVGDFDWGVADEALTNGNLYTRAVIDSACDVSVRCRAKWRAKRLRSLFLS